MRPFHKVMVVEEVADAAYYSVGAFATVSRLISQEMDLAR